MTLLADCDLMKSIDSLVNNLLKYSRRPEWKPRLTEVWQEHLDYAAEIIGVSTKSLAALIDENEWHDHLFGLVFEDFATRESTDEPSFARVYLERAGWREAPRARRYLEALAESRLGLYEVVEVQRERGLKLRDLVNDRAPIFVGEKSATRAVMRWDVIAARIVEEGQGRALTGGVVLLERDSANELVDILKRNHLELSPDLFGPAERSMQAADVLPVLVTSAWLSAAIGATDEVEITNAEGEPLLFGTAKLPLEGGADEIGRQLNAARDWQPADAQSASWVFLGGAATSSRGGSGRHHVVQSTTTGEMILGHAELTGDHLVFTTNSHGRMERGLARLQDLLADLLGPPTTVYERLDTDPERADRDREADPTQELSAEELASIKQELFDRHYRKTIRSRIPALGDKTPRQALRSKAGRRQVLDWLKEMERMEARRAAHTGEAPYDFTWIWQELGLLSERE